MFIYDHRALDKPQFSAIFEQLCSCMRKGDGAQGRNRTTDTRIFSPLLYQLSYLGAWLYGGHHASVAVCLHVKARVYRQFGAVCPDTEAPVLNL